jgi:hypothetical protein
MSLAILFNPLLNLPLVKPDRRSGNDTICVWIIVAVVGAPRGMVVGCDCRCRSGRWGMVAFVKTGFDFGEGLGGKEGFLVESG